MQTPNEKLINFLEDNPGSSKAAISEATGLKGIVLFNLLQKLTTEGLIFFVMNDGDTIYSISSEQAKPETLDNGNGSEETTSNEQPKNEESEVTEIVDREPESVHEEMTDIKRPKGRDNSKYKFGDQFYGKGFLVRAVVAAYVKDNPSITYKKLKEIFPDELLKRFGIFQEKTAAREISKKGERYFFKEEHVIKLKDENIVVCNQFTFDSIQPFLKVAKELGYNIK